jgi:hypothetical protein
MVPCDKILATARESRRRHRPLRPDHAVARRDGARGQGNDAPGLHRAAAHRRRHHQPRAHRGEDRARIRARRRPRARRLARRQRRQRPALAEQKPAFLADVAAKQQSASASSSPNAAAAARLLRSPKRAPAARPSTGPRVDMPRPEFLGTRTFEPIAARTRSSSSSTGAPSSARGNSTAATRHPQDAVVGVEATKLYSRRAGPARAHRIRETFHRESRPRLLARQRRRRQHRDLRRRGRAAGARDASTACASSSKSRPTSSTTASPTSSRRKTAAASTTSAASPSPPATASSNSPPNSRRPTTTTPRSWPRPSATGWPRRSPNSCTSARGTSAASAATENSVKELIREKYRGIRPAPGYPPARPHGKATLFRSSTRPPPPASR